MVKITPKEILFGGIGAVVTGALFEVGTKITDYILGSAVVLPLADILSYVGILLLAGGIIAVVIGVRGLRQKIPFAPTPKPPDRDTGPAGVTLIGTTETQVTKVSVPSGYTGVLDEQGTRDRIEDVEVRPEAEEHEQRSPANTEEDGR